MSRCIWSANKRPNITPGMVFVAKPEAFKEIAYLVLCNNTALSLTDLDAGYDWHARCIDDLTILKIWQTPADYYKDIFQV